MQRPEEPPPPRRAKASPPEYRSLDWDTIYREGSPAWETGQVASELVRVLDEGLVRSGRALEIGCGTGADALYLARRKFEVTAVDCSATAIERAHYRAELAGGQVHFVQADIFEFAARAEPFDFVYEAGFYHFMRRVNLEKYLDVLWKVTRPGSYYLCLAGAAGERAEGGPPQVTRREIQAELGRLFEIVQLRQFRFESPRRAEGFLGWSCLSRRPVLAE